MNHINFFFSIEIAVSIYILSLKVYVEIYHAYNPLLIKNFFEMSKASENLFVLSTLISFYFS